MRDHLFLIFLLVGGFFVIGEWTGWFVGVTGQTPVFVYKSDYQVAASRDTIARSDFPVQVSGTVRNGTVTVRVMYTDTGSFQQSRRGSDRQLVFEESYREGQRIAIDQLVEEGRGRYTVELTFDGATGLFRVPMPSQSLL